MLLATDLPGRFTPAEVAQARELVARPYTPSDWESVAPGHAVARACNGLILAHWYEPARAREIREASRMLTSVSILFSVSGKVTRT
ncbi:MAG TPA: hypothetical protein VFX98_17950 [Longimicrobiaceae bacterium]|nr:hypothetical protein [Longimicrobiaceae bacterium]